MFFLFNWKLAGLDTTVLPQRCVWNLDGFKFLGVYLGTVVYMNKNWEGMEEKIAARL